MFYLGSD